MISETPLFSKIVVSDSKLSYVKPELWPPLPLSHGVRTQRHLLQFLPFLQQVLVQGSLQKWRSLCSITVSKVPCTEPVCLCVGCQTYETYLLFQTTATLNRISQEMFSSQGAIIKILNKTMLSQQRVLHEPGRYLSGK